jgi:hypothetical protein
VKIFINGGLGNQLFQFAYAHQSLENRDPSIHVISDPNPRLDRPFDLQPILKECVHVRENNHRPLFSGKIIIFLQRISNKFFPNHEFSRKLMATKTYTEEMAFTFTPLKDKNSRIHIGYFQHWKYVESVWKTFGVELEKAISQVTLPSKISSQTLDEICVVHIRRGDLIRSVGTMGILDLNFYREALLQIKNNKSSNMTLVGITDDFAGANEISNELGLDVLLGPSELSSWQSIALMAKAGAVICANSTFSWWGGMLSVKSGGVVVIPDPWFVNWHEEVGDAFLHPAFIPVRASFLEKKDFDTDFKD